MRDLLAVVLASSVAALAACGGDDGDDGEDPPCVCDAAPAPDSALGEGGQGIGEFCDILPEGGPSCGSGLSCCDDNVCRLDSDCPGAGGFLPCDEGADCPNSFLCCQIPSMTFCTKQSACNAYGGVVIP